MLATKNQRIPDVNDVLRAAAKKGNLAVIRFLVEEGVDKDDADENDNNKTALMTLRCWNTSWNKVRTKRRQTSMASLLS